MRVALITSLNGGVGKFALSLSDKLGYKKDLNVVDLYCFANKKGIPLPKLNKKVRVVKSYSHPLSLLFWLFCNVQVLKEYDVIQINQATFIWPLFILRISHKRSIIVLSSRTTYIFEHLKSIEALFIMFDMFSLLVALRIANVHTTFSRFNRVGLKQRFNADPVVIYNGMDTSKFNFSEDKRRTIRKTLGLADDTPLILYLGLLLPYKNVIDLVNSMPRVLKQVPAAKLLILGRGPSLKELVDRTAELDLNRTITFKTEVVADITAYYSAADIFVFPATDGTHVLLEAMACDLPIIYAFSCSSPEIVGNAGISFRIHDELELSEKILFLLKNPGFRQKLKTEMRLGYSNSIGKM